MAFEADSAQCPHSDLAFELRHVMMENSNVHYVEMSAACKVCGVAMQFRGMPFGVTPAHPTMAMDGSEANPAPPGQGRGATGQPRGHGGPSSGQGGHVTATSTLRREPIRSRKLLDSARDQPCTMQVPGVCCHDPATTVSAHIRDESFGLGVKADDSSSAHMCFACHTWLDQGQWIGKMAEAEVLRLVLRALQRTLRNRIERGFVRIDLDRSKFSRKKTTPPRKPKDLRAKVSAGKPLQSKSTWPKGQKIAGRNDLRRGK